MKNTNNCILNIDDLIDIDVTSEEGINFISTSTNESFYDDVTDIINYDYNLDEFERSYIKSIHSPDNIYDLSIRYDSSNDIWKVGYINMLSYELYIENKSLTQALNDLKELAEKYIKDNQLEG